MLFFNSKKPVLADLIPNNYVDIHSHLLPGIDDGAATINDTFKLITDLQKIGFSEFITTPHIMEMVWPNTENNIEHLLNTTRNEIKNAGRTTQLAAAAEYMIDGNFVKQIDQKKLLTLKDNFVLVEMSYLNPPLNLYQVIFDLQLHGYQPVLAHPERYIFYRNNLSEFTKLKNAGCKFQMNLLSAVGYYGSAVSKIADYLLQNAMIDFVGSDVHHQKHVQSFYNRIILKNHDKLPQIINNNQFFSTNSAATL